MSNIQNLIKNKGHKAKDESALRFYQMPKVLFKSEIYRDLSLGARAMYSVLRDRQELSKKNNWTDKDGYYFLIYTIENLADELSVSERTVSTYKKELADAELLAEVRQGQGKPNRIYILKPNYDVEDVYDKSDNTSYPQAETIDNTKTRNICKSRLEDIASQDTQYLQTNDTEFNDTDFIDNQSINKKKKKDRLNDKNILVLLSKKYESDIITSAIQKANKAKENGTIINNLYSYLDSICKETEQEKKIFSNVERNYKKTDFHNKEQRSDKYSSDELEDVAKRKRREYVEKMKREANI